MTLVRSASLFVFSFLLITPAHSQAKKPNIVVIWGDDIGYWNLGIYSHGAMGQRH
jgi:arylsulfatase